MSSLMAGTPIPPAGGAPPETRSRLWVHPDSECLALGVATLFTEAARRAVKERGRFAVALSGGSTPREAYELLARPPFAHLVTWERVQVFWGDERCVDPRDARSNERMAREALLDHVPIPQENIHPIRCGTTGHGSGDESRTGGGAKGVDAGSPEERAGSAADDYERLLRGLFPETPLEPLGDIAAGGVRRRFALDLVLLGLGLDGHTASLFPGSEGLREERLWTSAAFTGGGQTTPGSVGVEQNTGFWRVTLTAQFINQAATVAFVVGGKAKAAIAREVLEGPVDPFRLPAQSIRPISGDLHWHLDDDSASLLTGSFANGAWYCPRSRPKP